MIGFEVDVPRQMLRYRCSGEVNLLQVEQALVRTVDSDRRALCRACLCDLRGCLVEISRSDILILLPAINHIRASGLRLERVAFVVDLYTQAFMIDDVYRSHRWRSRWEVFFDPDEACAWCLDGDALR